MMSELKERYNDNGELIKEVYADEYNELRHDFAQLQRQNDELVARIAALSGLCRFMCQTWTAIDKFVYENCDGDALMKYPAIQGTQNQFDLMKIGSQPFDRESSKAGANYLLRQQSTNDGSGGDE